MRVEATVKQYPIPQKKSFAIWLPEGSKIVGAGKDPSGQPSVNVMEAVDVTDLKKEPRTIVAMPTGGSHLLNDNDGLEFVGTVCSDDGLTSVHLFELFQTTGG